MGNKKKQEQKENDSKLYRRQRQEISLALKREENYQL